MNRDDAASAAVTMIDIVIAILRKASRPGGTGMFEVGEALGRKFWPARNTMGMQNESGYGMLRFHID
jgi:hypothetical protein